MRRRVGFFLIFGSLFSQTLQLKAQGPQSSAAEPPLGFTTQSTAQERQWEDKFKSIPDPKLTQAPVRRATSRKASACCCAALPPTLPGGSSTTNEVAPGTAWFTRLAALPG